jgi:phosphatidate phosphatase APP1
VSRPDWRRALRELASAIAVRVRRVGNAIDRARDADPYHVVGYRGFATHERVLVLGRALEDEGIAPADPSHSRWRNLVDALKRIEADPLPFARVRAQVAGAARELTADDEGFLRHWLPLPTPLPTPGWHTVELELDDPRCAGSGRVEERAKCSPRCGAAPVLVPSADARLGVISDMDDTVLQSGVTSFLRAARLVLLENARTRLPFPGVAAFYRALQGAAPGRPGNPIFYVSSSPWNLYDVIADFLEAQEIPAGPLMLRDWEIGPGLSRTKAHKDDAIREIFDAYPRLPFVLIGDSGQEDPEIYSAIVREHPGRILAIYIRNVTPHPERSAAIRSRRHATPPPTGGSTRVRSATSASRSAPTRGRPTPRWTRPARRLRARRRRSSWTTRCDAATSSDAARSSGGYVA